MSKEIDYLDFIKKMSNNKNHNIKLVEKYYKNQSVNIDDILVDIVEQKVIDKLEHKKILAINAFLECGANPNLKNCYEPNILFLHFESYQNLQEKNRLKLIEVCLKHGIDINSQTISGGTIMHYILRRYNRGQFLTSIYELLTKNNYDIFITDDKYRTLDTYYIVYKKDRSNNDPFVINYKKDREFFYQIKYKNIISIIEEKYPKLNVLNSNLLNDIVKKNYDEEMTFDIIKYLLEKGLNPNIQNDNGDNFIITAINCKHTYDYIYKLIKLSLNYGYDVNSKDIEGNTIIHLLLDRRFTFEIIPLFNLLKEHGFDYKVENNNKENILSMLLNNHQVLDREEFINKYSNLFSKESFNTIEELKDLGEIIYHHNINNCNYLEYVSFSSYGRCSAVIAKTGSLKTENLRYSAINHSNASAESYYPSNSFLTSADIILNNCESIGSIREILVFIMEKCIENRLALFIDDFDKIYNINNNEYYKKQLIILLDYYTNRKELELCISLNEINENILDNEDFNEFLGYRITLEDYNEEQISSYIDDYINENNNDIYINDNLLKLLKEALLILSKKENIIDDNISNIKVVKDILNNLYNNNTKNNIDIEDIVYNIKINKHINDKKKNIISKGLISLNSNYITDEKIKKLIKLKN